jgi:putative membrane protein
MCGWNGNGWMWNSGYGGGWGWVGWVVTAAVLVLVFAALITAAVFVARNVIGGHRGPGSGRGGGAEDVLAERFARGEIDEDEYRQRMTLLHEHR